MQWLAELCVHRPVFASVLILSFVVVGIFAFGQLGIDRLPQVDFPTVTVTTRLPGAAPEQVESEVTDKVEEAVNTISGIDQLNSNSAEGISQVIVTFRLEKNADVAAQEVRDRINRILPQLPRTILQPTIEKQDPDAAPVLTIAVTAKKPIRDVTEYTDKVLRRRLESADGVGQVLVLGGRKRQINLWVDADRLRAYNLTVNDISRTLQSQNADIPGGRIDAGAQSTTMRTRGRVERAEEFGDLVVRQVDGHPVQINDVGRVDDGVADATTLASINGDPTVLLQVRKQSGTNTVEVVNNVKERLAEVQQALPPGYELRIVRDGAEFIEASIRSVEEHLIVGSVLAAFVVLLFLGNLRSTVIAAISIPTSIVATFALLWYMNFTLNMLTMLALTLSVGIVIDDAIVVLENIYRFIEEKGMSPIQAAIEGTREIGLAVLATTMSLVAIFAPVGFMSGMVGRFMRSFGLTMAFAVMVSLLVAFTLIPTMSGRWLKVKPRTEDDDHHVHDSKHSKIFGPIDRIYTRMLEWSMAHRGMVAALAVMVLLASVPMFRIVNINFTPQDDQSEFDVSLRAPEGTSLDATEVTANRVASAIRQIPEVVYTMITVAGDSAGTLNTASIYVRLKPIGERGRDQFEIMDVVRNEVLPKAAPQGVKASLQAPGIAGGGGGGGQGGQGDVTFVLQGPDLQILERASNALAAKARSIPGLVDVDTSLRVGKPEMSVRLDRPKAADLGVQIADAADALRLLVGGDQVTTYNEAGEQYEVHLRAEEQQRGSEAAIARLTVPSSRLGAVPLENIASFAHADAPADIRRLNRQRQVTVGANMLPGTSQSAAQQQIAAEASQLGLGSEYRTGFAGRSRELNRTASAFLQALALSLIFMYLVLAAQFESWLHPVTILLSLPLTLPFALLSIVIFGQSLNIFSALGMLVLFGVVKKNSILQIDHANQLKEAGLDTRHAIVQACRDRLRPILMTTLAFVAGMIPLVLTSGVGSATNHAIGFVVIGGQTLVLLLTLLVTPVTYSLFEDARERRVVVRGFSWIRSKLPLPNPVTPV
ncbi:MAG TPA: efflux RND transporter permease subunit [Vicinamibacterales bacterium]|nr:efflux RND transporter permease subunit [Vicinamibacterales bacterium]